MGIFFTNTYAQDTAITSQNNAALKTEDSVQSFAPEKSVQQIPQNSVYHIKWKIDGPVLAAGFGLSAVGLSLIQNKDDLTQEELATKSKDDIPSFDRGNAGYYDENANDASYVPFFHPLVCPSQCCLLTKRNGTRQEKFW